MTLLPRKTSSNPKHLCVNFHFDKVLSLHWRLKGPASWFCNWWSWKYECVTWKTRAISVIFSRRNTLLNFPRIHNHSPVDQTNFRAFSGCILKTLAVSEILEGPACFCALASGLTSGIKFSTMSSSSCIVLAGELQQMRQVSLYSLVAISSERCCEEHISGTR